MSSPFVFGRLAVGAAFVNRKDERNRIKQNFISGINTMLISPRRWGKSSLIKQAANECLKENRNIRICFIDLFAIKNEHQFYETLISEVLKASDTRFESWIKTAKEYLRQIFPIFSLDLNNEGNLKLSLEWDQVRKNTTEILNLPEKIAAKRKIKFVICVVEFQKCASFSDGLQFQQILRSVWQTQQHCSYVLFGSKRHVITQLFKSQSMPFYKFGDLIYLDKIEKRHWLPFLNENYSVSGKEISIQMAGRLVDRVNNHPFYVQQLAHQVWINTNKKVTGKTIESAIDELLRYNGVMYHRELDSLTNLQIGLLEAISDGQTKLSSKEVLKKYKLVTPGNIQRIKEGLEKKEIIDFFERKPFFIDPFFEIWLKRNLF